MKSTTTINESAMVRAEPKNTHTVDIDTSVRLLHQCRYSSGSQTSLHVDPN